MHLRGVGVAKRLGMESPARITVIVYSARGLHSHRKEDVCHASVVFGHGKDFYTTETVQSNEPEWNQEASLLVSSHRQEPVKFKVKNKEHTLGVVSVSLTDLSNQRNRFWLPLQPHKKGHEVHGELQVGCWVTSYQTHDSESPNTSHVGSQEELLKVKINRRPFSFHHRSSSWSRKRPQRHSMHENMSNYAEQSGGFETERKTLQIFQSDTNLHSEGEEEGEQELCKSSAADVALFPSGESTCVPEVTGVSPNEGGVEGGQKVILRGSNLGESREDILKVVIAGVDCTETVEYFSPSKLVVVTLPRAAPGSGPVMVETIKGGVSVSWIKFTFVETSNKKNPPAKSQVDNSSLTLELKSYKQQVRELKERNNSLVEENGQLKKYIDHLLLAVIEHNPEVLEVKASASAPPNSLCDYLVQHRP